MRVNVWTYLYTHIHYLEILSSVVPESNLVTKKPRYLLRNSRMHYSCGIRTIPLRINETNNKSSRTQSPSANFNIVTFNGVFLILVPLTCGISFNTQFSISIIYHKRSVSALCIVWSILIFCTILFWILSSKINSSPIELRPNSFDITNVVQ